MERLLVLGEADRARLAKQLHDRAGQNVIGCRLLLAELFRDAAERPILFEKLQEITSQIGTDLQRLAMAVRPLPRHVDLAATLENYLIEWSAATRATVSAHLPALKQPRGFLIEVTVYHLVQDALEWNEQHGLTRNVSILAEEKSGVLSIIIDSEGAETGEAGPAVNLGADRGTQLMRQRAALIDATVEVESAPDNGATFFIRIPMPVGPAATIDR